MNCAQNLNGSNKDYATRDWLRNSSGVSPLCLTWRLQVFQWTKYASRSALKDSKSGHVLPRKNSSFKWPNTRSVVPLSMQLPLRDMLCTTPALSGPLVLLAHIRAQYRAGALRLPGHEPIERLMLLGRVGVRRRGPGDDLPAAEIADRREVGLPPGLLEPSDAGAHLLPRPVGSEVPADDVFEGLADLAPAGVVSVVIGLAADPAADARLAHHLERRLVGYARAPLGLQTHGDLPVAAPVGGAREYLGGCPQSSGLVGALGRESA